MAYGHTHVPLNKPFVGQQTSSDIPTFKAATLWLARLAALLLTGVGCSGASRGVRWVRTNPPLRPDPAVWWLKTLELVISQ